MTHKKLLFILPVTVTFTMLLLGLIYKNIAIVPIYNQSQFKFSDSDSILILGSSRSAHSFNPATVHGSVNAASQGECYFYTYYKLKYFLGIKNNFKKVIISYSPCNIPSNTELKLFDGKDTKNYFNQYFPIIDRDGKRILRKSLQNYIIYQLKYALGVPFGYTEDLKLIYKHFRGNLKLSDFSFFGGHEESSRIDTSHVYTDNKIPFYFFTKDSTFETSKVNLLYLRKIIQECNDHHLDLFLVSTPVHHSFKVKIPPYFTKEHNRIVTELENSYTNTHFIDLTNTMINDTCWYNADHVNKYGAEVLSKSVFSIINTNSIGKNALQLN